MESSTAGTPASGVPDVPREASISWILSSLTSQKVVGRGEKILWHRPTTGPQLFCGSAPPAGTYSWHHSFSFKPNAQFVSNRCCSKNLCCPQAQGAPLDSPSAIAPCCHEPDTPRIQKRFVTGKLKIRSSFASCFRGELANRLARPP